MDFRLGDLNVGAALEKLEFKLSPLESESALTARCCYAGEATRGLAAMLTHPRPWGGS